MCLRWMITEQFARRGDGMSIREIVRAFHHSRYKVRQVLEQSEPTPRSQARNRHAPVLGRLHAVIDQILASDEDAPPKQRHTARKCIVDFTTSTVISVATPKCNDMS